VKAGRIATVILFVASSATVFALDTAADSFNIILQVGAGTGLLYLTRWFWWRVTAWCEIVAMVSSFVVSIVILLLNRSGAGIGAAPALVITVIATTVCWVATAYLGPETDHATLIAFYRKVHPCGPGWNSIRAEAGVPASEDTDGRHFPLALLGWFVGCITIWAGLFMVGNFLYGRMGYAFGLLAVLAVSGSVLIWVITKLWK
jgi:hypothetical protein